MVLQFRWGEYTSSCAAEKQAAVHPPFISYFGSVQKHTFLAPWTQDYRLWASWSPYDGPKSFLLGRAESISLQRTWSPCTVNGPSSSHCKGPEVHPTLMDLGPSCWEGLSPPHIDGPKRAMHSQGSIPLQRTEFISPQWT